MDFGVLKDIVKWARVSEYRDYEENKTLLAIKPNEDIEITHEQFKDIMAAFPQTEYRLLNVDGLEFIVTLSG